MNHRPTLHWVIKPSQPLLIENLKKDLGIGEVLATVLVNRNIQNKEQAQVFFHPKLHNLHDPFLFYEMEQAVQRILSALEKREKILLYGDYDVDGITSTSLLYKFFSMLGADIQYYIPDRFKEGYGMKPSTIPQLHAKGANLIITLDCGIRELESIELARKMGMDVIVTDHHEPGEELPNAIAIINPKDTRGKYPFSGIVGVGVAFKLAWAISVKLSPGMEHKVRPELREFLLEALALVALGTVADVAPILEENRSMVAYGLLELQRSSNPGIQALRTVCQIQDSQLTPQHIAFRIGPRINAMGRLEHAQECVELFITKNVEKARNIAERLDRENQKRKGIQKKILEQAKEQIFRNHFENDKVLVLSQENWNIGVIGIVASHLQSEFYRPVCVIALNDNLGRGSARSIPGFDLCAALHSCSSHLVAFGGHGMAAGFEIYKDKIPSFREAINERAQSLLKQEQTQPFIEIDAVVNLSQIHWGLFYEIEKMAPFGEGNAEPILAAYDVEIVTNPLPQRCGNKGEHLKLWVKQGNYTFRAIAFFYGDIYDTLLQKRRCDIAFQLHKNIWEGMENLEIRIKDIHFKNNG